MPPFVELLSFAAGSLGKGCDPINPEDLASPKGPDLISRFLTVDGNQSRTQVSITNLRFS